MLGICVTFNGLLFSNSETSKLPLPSIISQKIPIVPIGAFTTLGKKTLQL